jgi:hypothetical protein
MTITCVAVPSKPPTFRSAKRSKVEIIKEKSDYLRHPLMQVRCVGALSRARCASDCLPTVAVAAAPVVVGGGGLAACQKAHYLGCLTQHTRRTRNHTHTTHTHPTTHTTAHNKHQQELVTAEPYISEEAMQLMKFHGSYMQDHREKRAFGTGKFYQFMMRTRQPSGLVTNQLYLVMDDLADQVGWLCGCFSRGRLVVAACVGGADGAGVAAAVGGGVRKKRPRGPPNPPNNPNTKTTFTLMHTTTTHAHTHPKTHKRAPTQQYGNGTLRLTTRQAYQLHGVLKQDLKTVFSSVVKAMGSTLGACGDVNRNVMGPAAPFKNRPEYMIAQEVRVCGECVFWARVCLCWVCVCVCVVCVRERGFARVSPLKKQPSKHPPKKTPTYIHNTQKKQSRSPTTSPTCSRRSRAPTTTCGSTARSLCRPSRKTPR